jgi:hypothetical protein
LLFRLIPSLDSSGSSRHLIPAIASVWQHVFSCFILSRPPKVSPGLFIVFYRAQCNSRSARLSTIVFNLFENAMIPLPPFCLMPATTFLTSSLPPPCASSLATDTPGPVPKRSVCWTCWQLAPGTSSPRSWFLASAKMLAAASGSLMGGYALCL